VVLLVFDNESAMARANITITVLDLPPIAVGEVIPTKINSSEIVYFTAEYSYDLEGPITYYWSYGDGDISTMATPEHKYTQPGIYTPILTVIDTLGQKNTIELPSVLVQNRVPVADFQAHGNFTVNSITFFDGSYSYDPESRITYFWDFGDDTNSYLGPVTNHSYTLPGNYTVVLTVKDNEGSTNTITRVVTIKPLPVQKGKPQKPESSEKDDSTLILGLFIIIVILIVLTILLFLLLQGHRKKPPEPSPELPLESPPEPPPSQPTPSLARPVQEIPPYSESEVQSQQPSITEPGEIPEDIETPEDVVYSPDQDLGSLESAPAQQEPQDYTIQEGDNQPGQPMQTHGVTEPSASSTQYEPVNANSTRAPIAQPVQDEKTNEQ
jgi:PKD repeat protein